MTNLLLLVALSTPLLQQPPSAWILYYAGNPYQGRSAYTVQDCVRLVAVVDTSGRPTGWLSNGGLFLQILATSGRGLFPRAGSGPAVGADWAQYIDSLLAPGGALARLDSAVSLVQQQVGPLGKPYDVVLMIPYPDQAAGSFNFQGMNYDMHVAARRGDLALAYTRLVQSRFRSAHYHHLALLGFYWFREDIQPADSAVVVAAAAGIHADKLRLFWIPYFRAASRDSWKQFGFDAAWLQPNYFFHREVAAVRMDSAVTEASTNGLGLEIEFDKRLLQSPLFRDRLEPYLSALETNPALVSRGLAVYEGAGALIELSRGKEMWQRALYARFVAVMTGHPE